MADAKEAPEVPEGQSSPLVRNLILYGIAILVPAILGAATFLLFIKPKLGEAAPPDQAVQAGPSDVFPPGVIEVVFDQDMAAVISDDPELQPPILMYQVALLARDQATFEAINGKKPLFQAKISKALRNRTEKELSDPYVQDTILRQIRQESNTLLKRLHPDRDLEVIEAMYLKFSPMAL